MADPATKADLLVQVQARYAALDEALAPILPAQMTVPGVNGAWSATDLLAHLTFWHQNLPARTEMDDDAWNLRCFLANRGRAPEDVTADLWRTQQAIVEAITALPESLLFAAGPHGAALWEAVDGTVLSHYPEHIAQIEAWRAQHVAFPTTKSDLLYRIADGWGALEATVAGLPPRALTLPTLHGGWSIKDEVAHVTFWEGRVLAVMQAALSGEEPPHPPLVGDWAKIEELNSAVLEESRRRAFDDVLADMTRTHEMFVRAVEQLSDDDLFDARRFAWTGGEPLAVAVAGDSYEHYPEHIRNIQRWRALGG